MTLPSWYSHMTLCVVSPLLYKLLACGTNRTREMMAGTLPRLGYNWGFSLSLLDHPGGSWLLDHRNTQATLGPGLWEEELGSPTNKQLKLMHKPHEGANLKVHLPAPVRSSKDSRLGWHLNDYLMRDTWARTAQLNAPKFPTQRNGEKKRLLCCCFKPSVW